MSDRAVAAALRKRLKLAKEAADRPRFIPEAFFFPKQKEFFDITAKNRAKVACCSRRAGKTIGIIGDAIKLARAEKNVRLLYITLTRENCLEIIWPDLMKYLEDFQIPVKINQQRLTVTFLETGSVFSCAGAKDEREIGKFRGRKLRRIYVDEAQNFPAYIAKMIREDLMPTLRDLGGDIVVTGTPGPLKRGFFYDILHNGAWAARTWTAFDNPHMHDPVNGKDLNVVLEQELALSGLDKNDPAYIRETYGVWHEDLNALVFKFDKTRNTGSPPPKLTYIMGVDLGYKDADAIAILGYNNLDGNVYLVEELVKHKQGISDLVEQIESLRKKYEPVRMVMDAGALGKKIQEEMRMRHQLPMEAADKNRKLEFIELMNDDLRTGRFKAIPGTRFEEDCYLVQWDRTNEDPTKIVISKSYHSDICDAVLYAWRECRHYFKEVAPVLPKLGTDAYMDALEEREAEAMENAKNGVFETDDWGVDQDELDGLDTYSSDEF